MRLKLNCFRLSANGFSMYIYRVSYRRYRLRLPDVAGGGKGAEGGGYRLTGYKHLDGGRIGMGANYHTHG